MLSKLLIICACLYGTNVMAQVNLTPVKTTEKRDTGVDYTLLGAPMPPLRLVIPSDSALEKMIPPEARKKTPLKGRRVMTAHDVDNGHNLFVMMFNPMCSHCEDVTFMLEKNLNDFKKNHVLLLADPAMGLYINDFIYLTHTRDYPDLKVGLDSSRFIKNTFLYQPLPQINIYDKHRRLIKTFTGEVTMDSLRPYMR